MADRLTWSRQPRERGLAGIVQRHRSLIAKLGGLEVGRVVFAAAERNFYFCMTRPDGKTFNSLWAAQSWPSEDEAKRAAISYFKGETEGRSDG